MDGSQSFDSGLVEALHGSDPEFEVWVDRVLDQYGTVVSFEAVGEVLHGEGVGRGACTDPQDVDAVFLCQFDMLRCGHLGGCEHACFFLHFLHPGQGGFAVALEASGLGAWLPDACTEYVAAFIGQLPCGGHHLFLGLSRTGACDYDGTFAVV